MPCGFLPSTVNDEQPTKKKSRQKPDNLPASESDQPEDEEEESDEDREEYYSLYDQLLKESENVYAEQESPTSQAEEPETYQSAKGDTQGRVEPSPEKQEVSVSSEKSVLNPEAPVFQSVNEELNQSHNLSESESVTAESVPATDPSERHSPGSEREGASTLRTSGDVQERMEVEDPEIAPDSEVPLRRSARERTVPRRFTYPTLGNPLLTVMHSILAGLDQAFSQALLDDAPYISNLTPLPTEIV